MFSLANGKGTEISGFRADARNVLGGRNMHCKVTKKCLDSQLAPLYPYSNLTMLLV